MADTIFKYLKKHTYESENTWDNSFAHTGFQMFKKHGYEPENTSDSFLSLLFHIFKKSILTNLKILGTIFLLTPFSNI